MFGIIGLSSAEGDIACAGKVGRKSGEAACPLDCRKRCEIRHRQLHQVSCSCCVDHIDIFLLIYSHTTPDICIHVSPTELCPFMPCFLGLLKEDDLAVKNVALLMVYSAVHHTPQLVVPYVKDLILPQIEELAQLNMERKIDLGPFKHTVDDALPLRKAALSVFATCLEKCPASLDIPAFMPVIAKALADVEDIQLQSHHIVLAMCSRYPGYVVAAADSFVVPLEKTVNKKKGQKTGTELERVHEWIKSGLRVMIAISKLDGAMTNRLFAEFVDRINNSSQHQVFLHAVEDES